MLVKQFLETLKAKGRGERTIVSLKEVLDGAEAFLKKPLEDAEYKDLLRFMEYLKSNGSNTNSLSLRGSQIVQFLKFCLNQSDDEKYNRLIRKFKDVVSERQKNDINPTELLNDTDIKKLINVATLERDRCIISTLYESGMRIGELMSLRIGMVELNEEKQEVTFHIPNMRGRGTKTGARSVVCLEVYGYIQDWLKCHPNPIPTEKLILISKSGVDKQVATIFKRAEIKKPSNLHNFRHSAITNACILKMKSYDISMRFWGIPNSNMMSVYVHLSEQVQADAYRDAKGMGNGNATTVINPLASRCVECGRLIQSGNLCPICQKAKEISQENYRLSSEVIKANDNVFTMQERVEKMQAELRNIHESKAEVEMAEVIHNRDQEIELLKSQMASIIKKLSERGI